MLRITEIFASVQGETSYSGYPFAFVRLTGCNLRCRYCDTTYAYDAGEEFPLEEVVSRVTAFGLTRACVTGGEPLLQEGAPALVATLLDRGPAAREGGWGAGSTPGSGCSFTSSSGGRTGEGCEAMTTDGKPLGIALVSGGMDSLVMAEFCTRESDLALLHVNYGQRTETKELSCFP